MSGETSTEILVVGAGPCGLAVGAAARRAGVECILVDKGPIVSSIERYPIGMTFFSTSDHLEVEDVPFVVTRDSPTRSEALKYYRRETEVAGVFVAGVLAAGFDANKIFIQNGREHGARIVKRFVEERGETPRR